MSHVKVPYIPSDEELTERLDIAASLFAGLLKHEGYQLPDELNQIAFDFSILDDMNGDEESK